MKAFAKMLSEETLNELKGKLGEDLTKQINDRLGDYAKKRYPLQNAKFML